MSKHRMIKYATLETLGCVLVATRLASESHAQLAFLSHEDWSDYLNSGSSEEGLGAKSCTSWIWGHGDCTAWAVEGSYTDGRQVSLGVLEHIVAYCRKPRGGKAWTAGRLFISWLLSKLPSVHFGSVEAACLARTQVQKLKSAILA